MVFMADPSLADLIANDAAHGRATRRADPAATTEDGAHASPDGSASGGVAVTLVHRGTSAGAQHHGGQCSGLKESNVSVHDETPEKV
jgi:hypothetical protein